MTRPREPEPEFALSVIVPVYNQQGSIGENLRVIHDRVAAALAERFEIIVVSDGSIDRTEEQLFESQPGAARVLHYDRNLGKGYAIKAGALEARGRWIGYVDADLDLDPGSLPRYLEIAEREELDFAIGSKRHPESQVHYPPSRRVASWLFQQVVRLLFRLDVRDTQVGLKVFRREIADEVMPFLLVKRFAFDIELLAVSRAFGFGRIRELPVSLEYRFTGSGVRTLAVAKALVDTAAIFYRLRILRTYQRKRALVGRYGWTRPRRHRPLVSIVGGDDGLRRRLDYPELEFVAAPEQARGEVLAFLEPGGSPAGNWLSATVPFLARADIGAVVAPSVAPAEGTVAQRAAAAVRESRLGGGSQYFRYLPGNIRFVRDLAGRSVVVKRAAWEELGRPSSATSFPEDAGERVVYTPETVVTAPAPPLFRPHLASVRDAGGRSGRAVRSRGARALRPTSLAPVVLVAWIVVGWPAVFFGEAATAVWLAGLGVYAFAVLAGAAIAAARYRSANVGVLTVPGFLATHVVYAAAYVAALIRR